MTKHFVRVLADVDCDWEGLPPTYRLYVNDELFAERTWVWNDDFYLKEDIQIEAEPGDYQIKYELVPPNLAELIVTKPAVQVGTATVSDQGLVRISNESQ